MAGEDWPQIRREMRELIREELIAELGVSVEVETYPLSTSPEGGYVKGHKVTIRLHLADDVISEDVGYIDP